MTTVTIEAQAGRGNIASPDMDLRVELRRNIIPKFLLDLGDVSWRRKYSSITTSTSVRVHNLPDDFFKMVKFFRKPLTWVPNEEPEGMAYIGEDPLLMSASEIATSTGTPTGYYIVQRATTNLWKAVKFDVQPDTIEAIPFVYLASPQFADDTTSVDLDQYILPEYQFGLVAGLRAEIFLDRFGRGDNRFERENERYQEWVVRAMEHKAQAPRNMGHFVS